MKIKTKLALGTAAALTALVAGSIAWASVPDPRGMITGCYDKQSGALRVTDTQTGLPKACGAKELQLLWNQQGPQGVPGPQGAQGPQGPAGGQVALHTQAVGQVTLAGVNGAAPMAIRGFSWGAENSAGGVGGGGGGKTTIGDVTLVRTIDPATPALVGDAVSGLHHQSAVVDLFVPGTQTAYVRYTLTDVLVSKIGHDGDDETFSLHPVQITEQTLPGATPPALPQGGQTGTLALDGYADVLPISGDGFEVDGPSGLTPATIHPLRIDLALGASAPKLALDTMTVIHRKTATVQTSKATYHLTDVVVRSVHDEATGAAGSIPVERITLDAAQVQVTAP
jgi:type VI protein secretion system component Hcp